MMDRYSAERSCPICGGHDRLPPGQGIRCAGFLGSDGKYARCTREQFAGGLDLDDKTVPAAYVHRLAGPCNCGVTHSEAPAPVHFCRKRVARFSALKSPILESRVAIRNHNKIGICISIIDRLSDKFT